MNGELFITEHELNTHFRGEYDLVTYGPYRVGDVVVRCSSCRNIIKREYVSDGCPLCNVSPFVSIPVLRNNVPAGNVAVNYRNDGFRFFVYLVISAVLGIGLLADNNIYDTFVGNGTFSMDTTLVIASIISFITCLVIYNSRDTKRVWRTGKNGFWLLLVPFISPFVAVLALELIIIAVQILIQIFIGVFVIVLFISFLAGAASS